MRVCQPIPTYHARASLPLRPLRHLHDPQPWYLMATSKPSGLTMKTFLRSGKPRTPKASQAQTTSPPRNPTKSKLVVLCL